MKTEITVSGGEKAELTADMIRAVVASNAPEKIRTYAVLVDGVAYPPKQLVCTALEIPRTGGPNSQDCVEACMRLGFGTLDPAAYDDKGKIVVPEDRQRTQDDEY
ncbi:hypothetical protein [Streptacidiphilus sp. MAP5-3]|uniref:hypothetical protein n=1 Tax=unclassified Streptacidiphilus TaxID=2643834 RepID=UPI003516E5C6